MQSRLDELLQAGRGVRPLDGDEARIWATVEHRVIHGPPPPPPLEAASMGFGGALSSKLTLKWIVGIVLVAGAGTGVGLTARGRVDEPMRVEPPHIEGVVALVSEPLPEVPPAVPVAPPVAEPDRPIVAVDLKTEPPVSKQTTRPRKPTSGGDADLALEMDLLVTARNALARGDSGGALAKLDEHRQRFKAQGDLLQERMALEVEVLCARGHVSAARRISARFLVNWPDSAHAPAVRRSCAGT